MNYFIGYLIEGEASEWQINISKQISDKFNTWKIYEKIPPHVTIFRPEEIEDVAEIRNYILGWIKHNKVFGNFNMSGFGLFEDRVVFSKIDADAPALKAIQILKDGLGNARGATKDNFQSWHPHSTLANKLEPEKIRQIWQFVNHLDKPHFLIPFNNLTIFKFTAGQKWVVDEYFKLSSK